MQDYEEFFEKHGEDIIRVKGVDDSNNLGFVSVEELFRAFKDRIRIELLEDGYI